jgi:hypothetical protein
MKTKIVCGLITLPGVLALQSTAYATFHLTQIEQSGQDISQSGSLCWESDAAVVMWRLSWGGAPILIVPGGNRTHI